MGYDDSRCPIHKQPVLADAPPPGPGSAASLTAQEQSALEKAAEQARGGLTADQLASKKKMIKASKEQRRRSVNVNFG